MKTYLLCAFVALIALQTTAQTASLKRAETSFDRMAYEDAAKHFEKAVNQGANELDVARSLAISYRKLRDFKNAEKWYSKMVLGKYAQPEDLYNLSEVLRSNGKYAESEFWLEEYRELVEGDSRVARQKNALAYLEDIWFEPILNCRIKNLQINSEFSDMGPMLWNEKFYFASSRSEMAGIESTYSWNDQPFLDIYTGDTALFGEVERLKEMDGPFNTKFHDSNLSFSPDGSVVYFTRNNFLDGKAGKNQEGINNLKIYYSTLENGAWGKEQQFSYNSNEYSVGHPAVNLDGTRLYFTSNMPGGYGQTDIYVCDRQEDGSWGQPQNLGSNVNTEGTEMFPYAYGDGTLYFASDGHKGLGGLDMHAVRITYNKAGIVENLGSPVNTGADDFGLVLNAKGTRGFFTSNRDGGKGDDDIYTFVLKEPMRFDMQVTGRVTLGYAGPTQPNMEVRLMDKAGSLIYTTTTNNQGQFHFDVDKGMDYSLVTGPANNEILLDFDTHNITEVPFNKNIDVVIPTLTGVTLWAWIRDMRTGRSLQDVEVKLIDTEGNELFRGNTDEDGNTRKSFPEAKINEELEYRVELDKKGYLPRSFNVNLKVDEYKEIALHEQLGDMFFMTPSYVGVELGDAMSLEPIYFEHNKSDITPEAAKELDQVAQVLTAFNNMVIECGSHTSALGADGYNKRLSQERAKATVEYLVSKGIDRERLKAKGYGETMLVNECADGIECSEDRHAFNRRTEFVILDM